MSKTSRSATKGPTRRRKEAMATEIVNFDIDPEDKIEFDRLVEIYGGGDRSEFLREAIRVMATRERAEHVQRIQALGHVRIGEPKTSE